MRKINLLIICLMLFLITSCTTTTSYKVTFKDIDGNIIETKNINSGESLNFPAPPKVEGYKFIIWEKDSSSTSNNIMYNATYERLMFKVVFYDLNNEVLETQEVYYGETAKDPSDKHELNNYLFLGWDKDFTSVKSNLPFLRFRARKAIISPVSLYLIYFVNSNPASFVMVAISPNLHTFHSSIFIPLYYRFRNTHS